ncbi:MAG: phosphatase PAP2 family protein [Bacteroidales bacterium]|jgi:undecaprenyl-diphosphatase|nr:phosphatase PAP2 family protein [Bacteroidales bacterium]
MIEWIKNIDTQLFLTLNGRNTDFFDPFFLWISHPQIWIPVILIVLFLLLRKTKKPWNLLLYLLLAIICSEQSCNFLKKSIQRVRPSHEITLVEQVNVVRQSDGTYYRGGQYSFPSAHASNGMVMLLFFVFAIRPKTKWLIIGTSLWLLLIAYSRIYLGVHYPCDILFGFLLGAFWSLLFFKLPTFMKRLMIAYRAKKAE